MKGVNSWGAELLNRTQPGAFQQLQGQNSDEVPYSSTRLLGLMESSLGTRLELPLEFAVWGTC